MDWTTMSKSLTKSLAYTLDVLNEACFNGVSLSSMQHRQITGFLLSRFEQPRSYRGLFAPTESDFAGPIRLFTGEKISTRAAIAHILSEETLKHLNWLQSKDKTIKPVLRKAGQTFAGFILDNHSRNQSPLGRYCCGNCSVSMWRHAASSGLSISRPILDSAADLLKKSRLSGGKWRGYPFYYTLLALLEFPEELAKKELMHAAVSCERAAGQNPKDDIYRLRRKQVCTRVLEFI